MSDPLYKKTLLRLAADAHGAGRLAEARHGKAFNPACGDKVEIDVALTDGRVREIAHETKACVLTQASASLLGQNAKGLSVEEVERLRETVAAMLAKTGAPPAAPFASYQEFEGAADFKGRHTCVLLPIDALLDALKGG